MEFDDEDLRGDLQHKLCREISKSTLAACEFSNYLKFDWNRVGPKLREKVEGYIAKLPEFAKIGYGIIFWGANLGHGKTSLAVQCALAAMRRGPVGGYFYELGDMAPLFSQPWNYLTLTGKPIGKKLKDVQFLVIDEVDDKVLLPNNRRWFKELIRHRYTKETVTFITTNYDPAVLIREFPWFKSILAERYLVIEVNDQDQRMRNARDNIHLTQ